MCSLLFFFLLCLSRSIIINMCVHCFVNSAENTEKIHKIQNEKCAYDLMMVRWVTVDTCPFFVPQYFIARILIYIPCRRTNASNKPNNDDFISYIVSVRESFLLRSFWWIVWSAILFWHWEFFDAKRWRDGFLEIISTNILRNAFFLTKGFHWINDYLQSSTSDWVFFPSWRKRLIPYDQQFRIDSLLGNVESSVWFSVFIHCRVIWIDFLVTFLTQNGDIRHMSFGNSLCSNRNIRNSNENVENRLS